MTASAKLFTTGRGQTVHLPKAFWLPGDEVWISKNESTGEIILTPKQPKEKLDALFKLIEAAEVPEEFMAERDNGPGEFREIF